MKCILSFAFSIFLIFQPLYSQSKVPPLALKGQYTCDRAYKKDEKLELSMPVMAILYEKNAKVLYPPSPEERQKGVIKFYLHPSIWGLYSVDENYMTYSFFRHSWASGPQKRIFKEASDMQYQYLVNTAHPETDSYLRIRKVTVGPIIGDINTIQSNGFTRNSVHVSPWLLRIPVKCYKNLF